MTTRTQITNIADKLDLTTYAGDFVGDYDMDAVHADYVDAIGELLPDGATLTRNGDVYAELDVADEVRDLDFDVLADPIDVVAIFERHDRTAQLLPAVTEATAAVEAAERRRVTAVRVAKNSGRFTGEQIGVAAGITRDAVYKMLSRSSPSVTFGSEAQAEWLAQLPGLAGNGHEVDVDGATATLTTAALDVLADLGDDEDGHYDGVHVWIGGSEYRVEG